jgi:hypothetical protein
LDSSIKPEAFGVLAGCPARRLDLGVELFWVAGLPLFRGVLGAEREAEAGLFLTGIVACGL